MRANLLLSFRPLWDVARLMESILELTPGGDLFCRNPAFPGQAAFADSESRGLLELAGGRPPGSADESIHFWRDFAAMAIRELCHLPETFSAIPSIGPPEEAVLEKWVLDAPPMKGAEYLSPQVLEVIWNRLVSFCMERLADCGSVSAFLESHAPFWSKVGRVTLHLAENRDDPEYPFAFIATYASGISREGKLHQLPLGRALKEYTGAGNKTVLLKLLSPLQRAATTSPLIADLVETADIFHPLSWQPEEAYEFLRSVPQLEEAGLVVKLPDWWKKPSGRARVTLSIGDAQRSKLGREALLGFRLQVEAAGRVLTPEEVEALLEGGDGLIRLRGSWVEVDSRKLRQALEHWQSLEKRGEISFAEGMRLLAGASPDLKPGAVEEPDRPWAYAQPGAWLRKVLEELRAPAHGNIPRALKAKLRPYQEEGLNWLWLCAQTGLGACLADDMGLGKTIQVLAALLRKQEQAPDGKPSLLVLPASLIGNWKRECETFAPSLKLFIAHRSECGDDVLAYPGKHLKKADLVITTYGMAKRLPWLTTTPWAWVILDEAQAIKNHAAAQSRAVRKLEAETRIALTGTPIENSLGDLWALFDFLNPGLLGKASEFTAFVRSLRSKNREHYAPLRRLVAPYILRRMKTDKSIISDLPDKTEMKVFCGLSKVQAKLYVRTADDLAAELENSEGGMRRRALVLTSLMRFKQICNHPSQFLGYGDYPVAESAKFERMSALCSEIDSRGEKALVFTQFRELTDPLENTLQTVFGRRGLVLHGGTPVKKRREIVESFQRPGGPPFLVLSLKAGGTGLNLTAASHVIHFDRWWNPAVENQATDRAFRIGQTRKVLVHKFVTSGTFEEKIDALLTEKQATADQVLGQGPEKALTEMSNEELLEFVRLDLHRSQ